MNKIRDAYRWARAHKRLTISLVAAAATYAAGHVPGLPVDDVVRVAAALLGA